MTTPSTLVLLSGGLDSTVLATHLACTGHVETISIHYGQRHRKELDAAKAVADQLGVRHDVIDLGILRNHLTGSALTDNVDVPDGHYAQESMRATVVPNRNAIMLSVAVGVAVARGLNQVATAVHAGDHFIYPDCRPGFITAMGQAATLGTEGFGDVRIIAPFVGMTKADIAGLGAHESAPVGLSWSCYKGGPVHCGRCGTCVERSESFKIAGVLDPTAYADTQFAATVTA
jgi:7-cyano-7-deazaguanine synthase